MAMIEGVDYASPCNEEHLAAAGKKFALRYVGTQSWKCITAAERDRIWAAGLSILLMFEDTADRALQGHVAGVADAKRARAAAATLGYPTSLPMLYAVDFDASPAQLAGPVLRYFEGIGTVDRAADDYGGIRTVDFLAVHKAAAGGFQSYAWSGGKWSGHGGIEQYHNGVRLAGGDVDLCRADSSLPMWEENMPLSPADINATATAVVDMLRNADVDPGKGSYTLFGAVETILLRTGLLNGMAAQVVAGVEAKLTPDGSGNVPLAEVKSALADVLAGTTIVVGPAVGE